MKTGILLVLALALVPVASFGQTKPGNWIKMFDGKTLDGWEANDNPESWTVKDGAIVGDGDRSHLFYKKEIRELRVQGRGAFESRRQLRHVLPRRICSRMA